MPTNAEPVVRPLILKFKASHPAILNFDGVQPCFRFHFLGLSRAFLSKHKLHISYFSTPGVIAVRRNSLWCYTTEDLRLVTSYISMNLTFLPRVISSARGLRASPIFEVGADKPASGSADTQPTLEVWPSRFIHVKNKNFNQNFQKAFNHTALHSLVN